MKALIKTLLRLTATVIFIMMIMSLLQMIAMQSFVETYNGETMNGIAVTIIASSPTINFSYIVMLMTAVLLWIFSERLALFLMSGTSESVVLDVNRHDFFVIGLRLLGILLMISAVEDIGVQIAQWLTVPDYVQNGYFTFYRFFPLVKVICGVLMVRFKFGQRGQVV